MDPIQTLSLALGSAWGSGINLYASILVLGLMQASGAIDLPPGLEILSSPLVIGVALVMYFAEFFADKVPGLDSLWDAIHTFVRIPAGAVLASQALGPVDPAVMLAAGLAGGSLAGISHAAKSATRLVVNTSPEPVSNWTVSIAEDIAVIAGVWAAIQHPYLFLSIFALFLVAVAVFLPKLWRGIRGLFRRIRGLFGRGPGPNDTLPVPR